MLRAQASWAHVRRLAQSKAANCGATARQVLSVMRVPEPLQEAAAPLREKLKRW